MKNITLPLFILFFCFASVYGQFSEQRPFTWKAEGNNNYRCADSDGDGDMDIFTSNGSTGPRLLINNGDNLFETPIYLTDNESDYTEHKLLDMDGDGDLDLVAFRSWIGQVALFSNLGGNTFEKTVLYNAEGVIRNMNVGDIDGDGDYDISFRLDMTGVQWLENIDGFEYTQHIILEDSEHISDLLHFDGDNDGDLDACIFSWPGTLNYYENLGDSYGAPVAISYYANTAAHFRSFDIDEDGDLDLIYGQPGETCVKLVENLGEGTFGDPVNFIEFVTPVLAPFTDIDGDGRLDFVVRDYIGEGDYYWKRNLGEGEFGELTLMIQVYGASMPYFEDFDQDGLVDLIKTESVQTIVFYKNLGDGEFAERQFLSETLFEPRFMDLSDLDNDGDLDILSGSRSDHRFVWIENLGSGQFSHLQTIYSDHVLHPKDVSAADIDGDGFEDILGATQITSEVFWLKNMADGTFGEPNLISDAQVNPRCVISEDWDGDGDMDVIISSEGDHQIRIYENIDGELDDAGSLITEEFFIERLESYDLNDDGLLDILFIRSIDDNVVWLENNGDLTFNEHVISEVFPDLANASTGDLDEDGDLDILIAHVDGVGWLENSGDGIFETSEILTIECPNPEIVRLADVNNDGKKDLIVAGTGDFTLSWCENIGDGEVAFGELNLIHDFVHYTSELFATDLDEDGDIDVISASILDGRLGWYENMFLSNHSVKGRIFYDENENGIMDGDEEGVNYTQATTSPMSYFSFTSESGNYNIAFNESELGDYAIFPEEIPNWHVTTATSYDVTIDGGYTLYEDLNFGLAISEAVNRVDAHLTGGAPRIDTEVNYRINYSNLGSTNPEGKLHLKLDDSLTYLSAEVTPEYIDGQDLYWSYESLGYFEDRGFNVRVLMPNFESINDKVTSYITIQVDSMESIVFTEMDSLEQIVQGAYDPNDKGVRPAGEGELGYIPPSTETLEYLVRFQNTGTDTAYIVVIEDQLDANLDWTSLEPLAWSHDMEIEVGHEGKISFIFDNIMLPDSNVNQLASNGFVKFQIDLLPDLPLGTSIYNTADIYFDANPAVVTNTTISTLHLEETSTITETGEQAIAIYPNPFSDFTTVYFNQNLEKPHTLIVYNVVGTEVYRYENVTGHQLQIRQANLGTGLYLLNLIDPENRKVIVQGKLVAE